MRPPVPERGFSKDHRGDLSQLVEILTVSADGAVPIAHRLVDGSLEDSTTHICTWDQLVAMLGTATFTYVADPKLCTRDNLDHIAHNGGRFLTILPKTRKEDGIGRAWVAGGAVFWEKIARHPRKKKDDPNRVYWAAEAPTTSAEATGSCGSPRRRSAPMTPRCARTGSSGHEPDSASFPTSSPHPAAS